VSFKFGGVEKHCLFLSVKFFAMLLIGHDLHHNYGLHVIGVFNDKCQNIHILALNLHLFNFLVFLYFVSFYFIFVFSMFL
jgi:hypothetical protein